MECALHRGIVTSIRFPAGVAVLPHVIRILERDCGDDVEIVRDSAVKGLVEIEGIVHSRLPPQRGVSVAKKAEDEEIMEDADDEIDTVEDMITEETVVEETIEQPIVHAQTEPPEISENPLNIAGPEAQHPTLPAFVTGSQAKQFTKSSTDPVTSTKLSESIKLESQHTRLAIPTTMKSTSSANDIFSMGAWKDVRAKDDEEDEDIPEIDMDFDSDEE